MNHSLNLDGIAQAVVANIHGEPPAPPVPGFSKLEYLGAGGVGQVWKAWWDEESRWVALKVARSPTDETAERFHREGVVLAGLDHSHIVRVFAARRLPDGTPFIVMELVEGATLANLLPPRGFPVDEAMDLFRPVLEAVIAAHAAGVVHRDLKPANILVSTEGSVKVVDFGLAAPIDRREVHLSLTQSGVVAGSVEYLPPEAYLPGAASTVVGDVYALGVVLYELLVGTPPRGAWRSASEIRHVDVRLDALIADAMHPDPAARLPSAEEFERRLDEITTSPARYSGTPLVTLPVRVMDALWTVTGLFCLLLGVSTTLHLDRSLSLLPLNLFGAYSEQMCRWLAFKTMLLCLGVMMLWQIARLWRFRRVRLREALPCPFGFRLGPSRTAATLTFFAQAVLVLVPVSIIWTLWGDLRWWDQSLPGWQHVLRVESYEQAPVSAWDWQAYSTGRDVRLAESHIDALGRTFRRDSRIDFRPGVEPTGLITAATVLWTGLTALALAASISLIKGRSRTTPHVVTGGLLATSLVLAVSLTKTLIDRHNSRFSDTSLAPHWQREEEEMCEFAQRVQHFRHDGYPGHIASFYAPGVYTSLISGEWVHRDELRARIEEERAARRNVRPTWNQMDFRRSPQGEDPASAIWVVEFDEEYFEDDIYQYAQYTGWSRASIERTRFHIQRDADRDWKVFREIRTVEPYYHAEGRPLDQSGAGAWLDSLCACLSTPGAENLEDFFNPQLLPPTSREPGPSGHRMVATLRSERALWALYDLSVKRLTGPSLSPGARQLLQPLLVRRRAQSAEAQLTEDTFPWTIEIAFIDGRWRIVRLKL